MPKVAGDWIVMLVKAWNRGGKVKRAVRAAAWSGTVMAVSWIVTGGTTAQLARTAHAVVLAPEHSGGWAALTLECARPFGFVSTIEAVQDRSIVGSGTYTVSLPRPEVGSGQVAPARGAQVEVVRCLPPGRLVQIATGRIEQADDTFLTAAVFVPRALASQQVEVPQRTLVTNRNLYWQPMRGDLVRVLEPAVTQIRKAWPQIRFDLAEIFKTRAGDEGAFLSLSAEGRKKLIEAFEPLEQHRGRFLIESEQTGVGDADLSEWTDVRGGIVAQLLSRVFEMDPSRFVVRGMGSRVASEEMFPVRFFGGQLSAGSIVIRVLPKE